MNKRCPKYCQPYLPDLLINAVIENSKYRADDIIEGSLLFVDLSGFTAMSEKLAAQGRIGAERLAEIINNCFNSLLALVFGAGGDIIKFGGDAFLVYFNGESGTFSAYQCAGNLINWISRNGLLETPTDRFRLGIHIGMSYGRIFNLYIGDSRREHLFCGKTVEDCYAAADVAELGELAVTGNAAAQIPAFKPDDSRDDMFICRNFDKLAEIEPGSREKIITDNYHTLADFLIRNIDSRLQVNNGILEGEHRVLTSLFIGVDSLRRNLEANMAGSILSINKYFSELNGIIEKYDGAFARLDSSGNSEKMLMFFGAPVSSGRDAYNCLKAVLEIEANLDLLNRQMVHPIRHRYGINTGICFVGDVGGLDRREYTAMGNAINLAARLMAKARYGQILVGADTLKICGESFITRDGGLAEIKGKKKPIRLYALEKEIERDISAGLIIGRDRELKQAESYIERIRQGRPETLLISGEPGAGKSLISGKIKAIASAAGLRCIEGDCFKHSEKTPYGPLKIILPWILGLNVNDNQKKRREILSAALKVIGETEWLPVIAPLLDYYPALPPHLKNLPEDIKKDRIRDILIDMICSENSRNRMLLIIEDIQWIDDTSFKIIQSLRENPAAPGILFISRPGDVCQKLKTTSGIKAMDLKGLDCENSRKLFLTILKDLTPDEEILSRVIEKSAGNPFYLEEMAKAFRELGPDKFAGRENIPTGIESVITARIDNLGEKLKKTIRTASVIGRVFSYNILNAIFNGARRDPRLREYLKELAQLDLTPLERVQPVLEYIFKHILTQEVAYNGLAFSSRQELHLRVAEFYSDRKSLVKRQPEVAGRHYLLAGKPGKALPFLYLAGQKAISEFANTEAFGFLDKVIEIAAELNDEDHLIKAIRNRGELAKLTGEFKLAEADYKQLKALARGDVGLKSDALRKLSEIHRLTAAYDKAGSVIDELEKMLPDDIPNRVFCLNGRGEILRRSGQLQEAREIFLKAAELCEKHKVAPELKAGVYNNLGVCHWGLGKMNESSQYYKSALKLYRELKDLSGQSKVTNNLGIIYDEMGRFHQATKAYEKAEKIFKRIGAARMQAFASANLGTNLHSRGYLGRARLKLVEARNIFEKIGDQHSLAYAIGDLGRLYFQIGDLEAAGKYLRDAYERARVLKDEEFILESEVRLIRLGDASGDFGFFDENNLLEKAEKIGSSELRIKTLIIKGQVQIRKHDYSGVKKTIRAAQKIEEINVNPELAVELAKLEVLFAALNNDLINAAKITNTYLKKAISSDLAMIALELFFLADIFGITAKIDKRVMTKIRLFFKRMRSSIGKENSERLIACHRRKVEILRNFMSSNARDISPEKTPAAY